MRVVDHEPGFWFLLAQDERLLLDVNCEHGAVGYDVLIELNEIERAEYLRRQHAYLSELAEVINYSAPGVRGSQSPYKVRNIWSQLGAHVVKAVSELGSQGRQEGLS
jgi:hypothetical protein